MGNFVDGVHLTKGGYKQIASAISGKIESAKIFS
jgi:lysophospholipase L1-like esterase